MSTVNLLLWVLGLALQIGLVVVLFLRRVARRFPVFTALIAFYVLRSCLLVALFGYVARNTYFQLYDVFSFADLCLQILLAAEIAFSILRRRSGWPLRRMVKVAALVILALAIAGGAAALLPAPGRVPVDRGGAFAAFLMVLVVLCEVFARVSGAPRRIAAGFAFYGVSGVIAGVTRSYAAPHRLAVAYAASSYAQAAIYILMVVYWLYTFGTEPAAS
jgi:hypothetical protein